MSYAKRQKTIDLLTIAETKALLATCSMQAPTGQRDHAIVAVLYATGTRISELLGVMPKDLDLKAGTMAVQGKGSKVRSVALSVSALRSLERWLGTRKALGLGGKQKVFCTISKGTNSWGRKHKPGRMMHPVAVRQMLTRRAGKAGIEKRVHPHMFRHMFTHRCIDQAMPLNKLQKTLGHSSLQVTSNYAETINPAETLDAMRQLRDDLA